MIIISTLLSLLSTYLGFTYQEKDFKNIKTNLALSVSLVFVISLSLEYLDLLSYYLIFLVNIMLILTIVDIRYQVVPYRYTLLYLLVTVAFFNDNLVYRVLSLVVSYAVLWIFALGFKKIIKRDALGGGDINILAITCYLMGAIYSYLAFFIAAVIGLIVIKIKKINEHFAFIPFLAIGIILAYIIYLKGVDYYDIITIL